MNQIKLYDVILEVKYYHLPAAVFIRHRIVSTLKLFY